VFEILSVEEIFSPQPEEPSLSFIRWSVGPSFGWLKPEKIGLVWLLKIVV